MRIARGNGLLHAWRCPLWFCECLHLFQLVMQHDFNPLKKPSIPVKRRSPNSAARGRDAAILAHRRSQKAGQWRSLVIGVIVVGAVFVGLGLSQKSPKGPAPAIQKTLPGPTAKVETPAAPNVAEPVIPETTNVAPEVASPVPTAPTVPQELTNRKVSEAELLEKEAALVLTDLDSRRENAVLRDKELFKRAIAGKAWNAYRGLLAKSMDAGMVKLAKGGGLNRFDAIWKEPVFYQAFLRWQLLGRLSEQEISAHVRDGYSGELLTWLCYNTPAMEEFLLTMKPEDDGSKVLQFLMKAWPITTGRMEKYFPLALACAVVFDREIAIPNPVAGPYAQQTMIAPLERYSWFIDKNEKGQLAAPVHSSSASDLVWVVCAPVSTSELEWSLDKIHLSRKHWGNAYGMIEYLMERAVKGLNPYKEYSFSEILKEGGICGDQSYFCANTARAQGIPAMTFAGETDLGGHAWVGLKVQADEWTTGVGRIGGVSKGETDNPQTGASITEQEVLLWSDRAHQSRVTTLSVMRHLWLADYFGTTGKDANHAETVRLANQLGASFPETWAALYGLLQKQMELTGEPAKPSNLEEWKSFARAMRQEFKDNPRMAALAGKAETEYIFPYGDEGDAARTLARERRSVERNSGEQKDLIAESLKREAELIYKRGDASAKKDISNLYDSALRKYGGSITGFKMMAEDYFGYLKDDPELAHKAARDIELAFKRVLETGTKDWFRAQTEASIQKMICDYYRAAGDDTRAALLEKRSQTLLKRAERSAL